MILRYTATTEALRQHVVAHEPVEDRLVDGQKRFRTAGRNHRVVEGEIIFDPLRGAILIAPEQGLFDRGQLVMGGNDLRFPIEVPGGK